VIEIGKISRFMVKLLKGKVKGIWIFENNDMED